MFEVVVRPVVFPNIRPNRPRVLLAPAPETTPGEGEVAPGFAVIGGSGGRLIDLPHSFSSSISSSHPSIETKRQFTTERIHQVEQNARGGAGKQKDTNGGVINTENFVVVERITKLRVEGEGGVAQRIHFAEPPERDNVVILNVDQVRNS